VSTAQRDVELVRRFNESWSDGDLAAVLDCAHPEMQFDWSESIGPFRGIYRGHDGLRRYWDDVKDAWDRFSPEIDDLIDCGAGRIVAVTTVRGRARASGIEVEARGVMLWVVRDGVIASGKLFQNADDALAAAREPT